MMVKNNPIYGSKSDEIMKLISKMISSHNTLCSVEDVFADNEIASKYFEEAEKEVLDSGNQSLASMFVIAIQNMAEYIKDCENSKEMSDVSELQCRIYKLESENRVLRSKINTVKKLINISKEV